MMISGKEGMLTERDEAILTDLYFTRMLSTQQIAWLYFPSYASAKQRLYQLRRYKGVIEPMTPETDLTVWTLTKPAFWRKAEFIDPEDRYRGFPATYFIRHMLDTNDLYAGLRDDLDRIFGDPTAWQWKDEARLIQERSSKPNNSSKKTKKKQPDAELSFKGNHYFIERETKRSKATPEELDDKVDGYRRYFGRLGEPEGEREVIVACDLERDKDRVLEAADKYDVDLSAGTVEGITKYLIQKAKDAAAPKVSQ